MAGLSPGRSSALLAADFLNRVVGLATYTVFVGGIYIETGSTFAIGILGLAIAAPALLVIFVLGSVIARVTPRVTFLGLLAGRCVLFVGAALLPTSAEVIVTAAAVNSLLYQSSLATKMSWDALMVDASGRARYLSNRGVLTSLALMIGPPLGGFAVGNVGFASALGAAAVVLAAGLTVAFFVPAAAASGTPQQRASTGSGSAIESARLLRTKPLVFSAVALYALVAVILESEAPLIFPFVQEEHGLGAQVSGTLLGLGGIGGVLGAVASRRLLHRLSPATIPGLIAADGVLFAGFILSPNLWIGGALFVLLGAMGSITIVIVESLVQAEISESARPFVFSVMQFSGSAGGAVFALIATFAAGLTTAAVVLLVMAAIEIVLGAGFLMWSRAADPPPLRG